MKKIFKLRLILLVYIICSVNSFTTAKEPSVGSLASAYEVHATNMVKLGDALLKMSDLFKELNPSILQEFLLQYGKVKIDVLQKSCDLDLAKTIDCDRLHHYLTVDTTGLPEAEQERAKELFKQISELERLSARRFFIGKQILGQDERLKDNFLTKKYLQVARIVQVVERAHSADSQSMYGRAMLPAHHYFESVLNDSQSAKLALKLETELKLLKANGGRSTRLVRTPVEYRLYNFTHILRTTKVGLAVRDRFDQFDNVDPKILEEFLLLHDQTKINQSPEFSTRYELATGDESISSKLFQNYGIDFSAIPPAWQNETKKLVSELNAADKAVALSFFRKKGLLAPTADLESSPVVQKYLLIEQIADLVDRGESPITAEEFGRPMLPAHTFFIKVLKNQESAAVAMVLEHDYERIIRGWSYTQQVPLLRQWFRSSKLGHINDKRYAGLECVRLMMQIFSHDLPRASML
ncbi:MAG: hypothetical protein ISR65_13975 [Bacteriovoracaceae bacterium]|nr:hypothetical protein [Bacteriovoracaceae bacterium]